jgi:hypothetical protein
MRKVLPILTLILFAVALVLPLSQPQTVEGQTATEALTTDMRLDRVAESERAGAP